MAFAEGLNNSILFPALLKYFEDKRAMEERMNRFNQFGQATTETVYKPQGETVYGKPEGIGVRYPTTLPTVQPTQQGVPLDSPQFLNAAMQFLGGGGSQPDLNSLIQLRTMGLPQYTTTEGAQGQLLEQEKNRLTGQTKGVRQLTPPAFNSGQAINIRDENILENGKTYRYRHFYDKMGNEVKPKVNLGEVMVSQGAGSSPFVFLPSAEGYVPANKKTGTVGQTTGLGKPLTAEMITQNQQLSGLKESLNKVKEDYSPDYVGAISGRVGGLQEATVGVPEQQARFYSNLADIKNTLIYLKSGKQINESEYQRLLQQLPDRNNPEDVFNARLGEFERILNNIESTRQANMGGYGSQRNQKQVKVGDVKTFPNGKRGRWDGTGWELIP